MRRKVARSRLPRPSASSSSDGSRRESAAISPRKNSDARPNSCAMRISQATPVQRSRRISSALVAEHERLAPAAVEPGGDARRHRRPGRWRRDGRRARPGRRARAQQPLGRAPRPRFPPHGHVARPPWPGRARRGRARRRAAPGAGGGPGSRRRGPCRPGQADAPPPSRCRCGAGPGRGSGVSSRSLEAEAAQAEPGAPRAASESSAVRGVSGSCMPSVASTVVGAPARPRRCGR